jgi:hypothetical protein
VDAIRERIALVPAVVAPARRLALGLALLFVLAGAQPASAGTPILVVKSPSQPFSDYVREILRAEGLNGATYVDGGAVNASVLAGHDVVVLGDIAITPAEAAAYAGWVNAGGNLIALSPDPQLAGLLGLSGPGGSLSDGYLTVNTSGPPGAGIVAEPIQFHGTADLYGLNGAGAVATLSSGHPAVTLRSVGAAGGEAAAFTFDLARSVVYTRQGNPAWAGQNRDAYAPVRTNDLFYPNWVDLNKIHIPQADELQRLFANLITYMNRDRTPVPRFWYLPRDEKAAVVMTGDDHDNEGTAGRFEQYKAMSPAHCVVQNWECVRSTSYVYQGTALLPDALAAWYESQGFEVALHPSDGGCGFYTYAEYFQIYQEDLLTGEEDGFPLGWKQLYPSVSMPVTSRFHCVSWTDWSSHAKVEVAHGIRLDTNYYHYPPEWGDRPGFMTGSGEIMKFADLDGTTIPLYQAHTHINDEAMDEDLGQVTFAINSLLGRALGPEGYYGMFTANMHTDEVQSDGSDAIVAAAQARGVPIISARQALQWVEGRDGSSFTDFSWSGGRLGFTVNAGASGLTGMVPLNSSTGKIVALTRNGAAVPLTAGTIKGVEYAFFDAAGGRYEASYPFAGPGGTGRSTNDRTAPRLKLRMARKIRLRRLLRKGLAYRVRCSEPCRLRVRLAAKLGKRTVTLGTARRRRLRASHAVRVVVKVRAKPARRLRRKPPRRITLRNTATDMAGNSRTVVRRIRLIR